MTSLLGLWDEVHAAHGDHPYGSEDTYRLAAEWLDGHGDVYDWGGGTGYARRFFTRSRYFNVDGSGEAKDIRSDLLNYHGPSPSILIRHVLEHNLAWRKLLGNALATFTKRMALVTFGPQLLETKVYRWDGPIPYVAISRAELLEQLWPVLVRDQTVQVGGTFETVWLLARRKEADAPEPQSR